MTAHEPAAAPDSGARDDQPPANSVVTSGSAPTSTHAHLWTDTHQTGLHAPFGVVVVEDGTGRLCCHYCGRWYAFLGAHVRAHGLTAQQYRMHVGLRLGQSLISATLSRAVATRQQRRYRTSPELRESFAHGQALARDGALGRLNAERRAAEPLPSTSVARRDGALAAGRRSREAQRRERLDEVVSRAGSTDLPAYLRARYANDASLEQLARETGLGRSNLRQVMSAAGITLRVPGSTTAQGRRSRADVAEAEAATRVGTDDLLAWLAARRAEGWTLERLGRAVGHSGHWVRWRLDATTKDSPRIGQAIG